MRAAGTVLLAFRYALALAALVVFLFPLYWLLITALKTPEEVVTHPPVWWPHAPQLGNFASLMERSSASAIVYSLAVACASTVLAVGFGTAAAYALGRGGLGRRLFVGWGVAARMVPPIMIAAPLLLYFGRIGWPADVAVLVIMLAAFNLPYVVWMMRGYFREFPAALEEMALVAGLTREQVFARIVWPMARGGFLATAAFTFVLAWNELVFALVLTGEDATTLPALLARQPGGPELWGKTAALGVAGVLPVLLALALMRRRLARCLSLGIVRGEA